MNKTSLALAAALTFFGSGATLASEQVRKEVAAIVTKKAQKHGIPSRLAHAVVKAESNYNCRAKNPSSSASGAMQVLRKTAHSVGITGSLFNCVNGIEAGMRYLKIAYEKADGDWCGTATLYNRGVGAKPVRSSYCKKILSLAK